MFIFPVIFSQVALCLSKGSQYYASYDVCFLPNFDGISLITRISLLKSSVYSEYLLGQIFVLQRMNVIFDHCSLSQKC